VQLTLTNYPGERRRLLLLLHAFAKKHGVFPRVLQAADQALEEHLTNVVNYAYADHSPHEILVRLEIVGDLLQIEVEDDGGPFNPLEQPPPDITIPLIDRPIGGLGIHLIRQFMDELHYRREEGHNIFQMRKRLQPLTAKLS
jgi:anti-sigma regulatory factor (Ser/Thr protein kinase)